MWHILLDAARTAVLVSGLVVVMMMIIESLNIDSRGRLLGKLKSSKPAQVILSALLGMTPGCVGGFASVSLYTHGVISFGALIAMMIASSGDEAFVMLAAFPEKAWWIFLILLAIGIVSGFAVDAFVRNPAPRGICSGQFEVHDEDHHAHGDEGHKHNRSLSWKRIVMFLGVSAFITALLAGWLECGGHAHESGAHCCESHACQCESHSAFGFNLLSEEWMYWMFGALSLIVIAVLVIGSDHFVEEHLWQHIIRKHLLTIFLWTFGTLLIVGIAMSYCDIASWIDSNTALMIALATLIGIIPESGPHLIFVTLYASGVLPLPVLLASCISQDGHASLPLLAESRRDFVKAKIINCIVALIVGFGTMLLI